MKTKQILAAIVVDAVAMLTVPWSAGAIGLLCVTKESCEQNYGVGKCCVTQVQTNPIYKCPDGWTLGLMNKCSRTKDTGSDSKGYTETTYGTCNATNTGMTEQKRCWGPKESSGITVQCISTN